MLNRAFLLVLCMVYSQNEPACRINSRRDFNEPLPVIIRDGKYLEPTSRNGDVEIAFNETIVLSCIDSFIENPNTKSTAATASVTCHAGNTFGNDAWLTSPTPFYLFKCTDDPEYHCVSTNRICYDSNQVYEVGYSVNNQFYPLYETCFDERTLTPIYSKYTQRPYNANFQTRIKRPYFKAESIFGTIDVGKLFSPHGFKAAVGNRIGFSVERYFKNSQILSRGHLAAKTDFVFAFGERATFHYLNCAPQWTGFNGGNWNTLEVDLRNHIHDIDHNTIIYTGVYGVSSLINDDGDAIDLFLADDINGNQVVPVPLYFYKVVYSPSNGKGIAFVGINNPYLENVSEYFFCEDVCRTNRDFSWLTCEFDSARDGVMFCCRVDDFRKTVKHLPPFDVRGLLT